MLWENISQRKRKRIKLPFGVAISISTSSFYYVGMRLGKRFDKYSWIFFLTTKIENKRRKKK